jgi:apolipoprotein N-acyltransferase
MLEDDMQNAQSSFFTAYRLPILAGFLIGTSYIPFPPWALFFCLVPLIVFWSRTNSGKSAFIGGWITQFILNLIGFHWIAYTAVEFGHFPWWAGLLALFGFAALAHLHYPIAAWLAWHLNRRLSLRPWARFLSFAAIFALTDRLMPMIFPWHLGYPWIWAGLPGHQFADVIGFEGLNVFTILINTLLAWAVADGLLRRQASSRRRPALIAGSAAALFLALNLVGLGRAERWKRTDSEISILAVQGNIGNFDKLMAELRQNFGYPVVQKYLDLTRKGMSEHPDSELILWPETAFPMLLDGHVLDESLQTSVRRYVNEAGIPILTGAYSRDLQSPHVYNGFFYVDGREQATVPPYRKSILLVFGETFPFSEYLPYMDKLFPNQGSFGRGSGPTMLSIKAGGQGAQELRIGPQICYEGLYPWFSTALARDGAQIFVNVTNDSWFGKTFEPRQHLYMTLARAVELRRPLMRATNTGITTAILASGEVLQQSPIGEEWTGQYKIPYVSDPAHTFYEKYGFAWPWVLAFSIAFLVLFGRTGGTETHNGRSQIT